jgi:glutamate-1-semialdehyde 2,1-aminomutase
MNKALARRQLRGWTVYGDASLFHLLVGSDAGIPAGAPPHGLLVAELKRGGNPRLLQQLRMAMLINGVDLMRGRSGFVSAAHDEDDIHATVAAFDRALDMLAAEGLIEAPLDKGGV